MAAEKGGINSLRRVNLWGRTKDAGNAFLKGTTRVFTNTAGAIWDTIKMVKNRTLNTMTPFVELLLAGAPWRKGYSPQIVDVLTKASK